MKPTLRYLQIFVNITQKNVIKNIDNRCVAKMNAYQGLYNTNNALATMHVLYNDDFDRLNNQIDFLDIIVLKYNVCKYAQYDFNIYGYEILI